MSERCELLIGCGRSREKRISLDGEMVWNGLVTLDCNKAHNPDVLHDLETFPWPFKDDSVDELHAYEVIEHCSGQQGDGEALFRFFSESWRILKPGAVLLATVPRHDSQWAWGDMSHKRVITRGTLIFLNQPEYERLDVPMPLSDWRFCYRADFDTIHLQESGESLIFVLKAIKPSRIKI